MLFLVALAALAQSDQPPRLRTVLENGAVVLVEPMPKAQMISVQLFASSKHVLETSATHGFRHLLEHLIARGDGTLDRSLETQGCFLTARTLRDAMQIEVRVGPNQLDTGLKTIGMLLQKPTFTQERIDREVRVMRDELAMQDDSAYLSSASWLAAYGDGGFDPMGTFDSLYRATPEKLEEVFQKQFAADGLVVVIAGPVNLDKTTNMARALLGNRAKPPAKTESARGEGKPGRAESFGFGESRGAIVPGFNTPPAMGALAAALAIASDVPNCFVTYTPTVQNGLVIVGRTDRNSGLGLYVDGVQNPADLYSVGKSLAKEWVLRQLRTPSGVAYLRGLLLSQGISYRPEQMLSQVDALTQAEFASAFKRFTSDHAVTAVGTR